MKPKIDELCKTRAHCVACRAVGDEGDRFRAGLAEGFVVPAGWPACPQGLPMGAGSPYPGSVPLTVRGTRGGMAIEEPAGATIQQATSYARALLTAPRVPADVTAEREATCRACEHARWSLTADAPWCSICGCKVGGEVTGILRYAMKKLSEVEENLPKWGCHHPQRNKGMGWKR